MRVEDTPVRTSEAMEAALRRINDLPPPEEMRSVPVLGMFGYGYDDYADSVYVDAPYDDYQDS